MKFGKQLAAQQVPVWAQFYLDYKGLKKIINSLAKGRPADAALLAAGIRPPGFKSRNNDNTVSNAAALDNIRETSQVHAVASTAASANIDSEHPASTTSSATIVNGSADHQSLVPDNGESALLQAHKAAFFFKLERELEKINAFYLQKEAEMKSRMRALIDKRKMVQSRLAGTLSRESAAFIALHEGLRFFERDLSKLQNYIEMNATGFRKILKKWDKRSKSTTKELYLARQVDVQPCFNRDVISELSDTAAANVRKLEGLCIARGGEQTVDPAADGILSERKAEMAAVNAQAQDDMLSNIETELLSAVRLRDKPAANAILSSICAQEHLPSDVQSQLARIYWRAAIIDADGEGAIIDAANAQLRFNFVDDINGRTPLIEASVRGKKSLIALCVANGVNVLHKDVYGRQALHYAAMCSPEVCAFLLQNGADANAVDYDGSSPLLHAISAGQLGCVDVLLQAQAEQASSPSTLNAEFVLPIALAAKEGHVSIITMLLQRGHKIKPDASGYLPQHIAAREGHIEVLQKLLEAGADINAIDKFANWTAVFHAANEGHLNCVRVLLAAGADLSIVDDQGKTAVHHAAWSGHPDIVSALLAALPSPTQSRDSTLGKMSATSPQTSKKRTAAEAAGGSTDDMDLDGDAIPDLSLPPPALPLRTYGHSYLDTKRALVQLTLGHPTTSDKPKQAIRFYRQQELASLKLVITSKSDTFNVPHTITLPLQDERECISLSVDSLENLTLEFEILPTFGSRLIGKAVCLSSTFASLKSCEGFTAPVLDTHLGLIGEVNFEANVISHFDNVQLAIGGRLETYWKSIASETPARLNSWKANTTMQEDLAFVTASSLGGEYVKLVVQVTQDCVPVTYPVWKLPSDIFDCHVSDVTAEQLATLASRLGRTPRSSPAPASSSSSDWYQYLQNVIAPLEEVLKICPPELGLNIEVRYPTSSDVQRLGIRGLVDINASVDAVLSAVYANALSANGTGRARRLLFSSFSPIACATLNWKQPTYAVLFASYCGLSRSTPQGQLHSPHRQELDKRCTSIEGAVKFAKANNVFGVLLDSTIVVQVPSLVQSIKESGLLLGLFGKTQKNISDIDADSTAEGVLSARSTSTG